MTIDLTTSGGLEAALGQAGWSYAELSRRSGVPASTLKSRAARLGVQRPQRALVEVHLQPEAERATRAELGARDGEGAKWTDLAEKHRKQEIEALLAGESHDLSEDEFALLVELDTPLARGDHLRLMRVASLALQYYRTNQTPNQREFIRKIAATCNVDPDDLKAYCLVLQNEVRYRERTGQPPLETLPRLTKSDNAGQAASMISDGEM